MRNFLVISSLAILSFLLSPARSEAQELFKVNLQGDSLYRATKDVPFAFQTGPSTVYLEYTNLTREVVSMSLDTFIERACSKYFKATLEDNRVVAINKDFVKRIQTRSGGKSYVYMIHTPTRYDLKESLPTVISRLALCQGGSVAGSSSLFVKGDSVCITGGNCVFLPSSLPYTAGAGIDITGNVITNIGDPNPNDDVLKTTNHDGDVTGVYNSLTIKNGVIGVEKLDSAAVLTWVNDNVDIDTSNIDLNTLLTWLYQNIDTVDTDSQSLYLANDSLFITRGNGIPLDTIRGDAMPFGQRGETLWRDSTGWVADSTIYNDSDRIGMKTDTLFSGTLTVGSDWDEPAVTLVSDSSILQLTPGEKVFIEPSTDLVIRQRGDTLGRLLISRDSLYSASFEGYSIGVSRDYSHTSGPQSMVDIGTDASGNVATFSPQSGNGDFAFLRVSGELNADSAASGQVRGIWIQPVLTSYPQNLGTAYRAIDIASSGGIGLYQSGALVENRLRGNTMIGSTGRPLQTLDVSGTMRLRGSVSGGDGLLGVKLGNGDVGYIRIGSGLIMSGDTLYATAAGGGDTIPDGTVLWSTLHWNGSDWVENDSLLVDPQGHGALGMPIDTLYSLNARKDLNVNSHTVGRGNGNQITNVVLGSPMASANTAQYNTAIGREALNANLSGGNTAVGSWALRKHNQNGGFGHNTGLGFNSLGETTTGFSNTGIGSYSLASNTTGNFNVAVGYNAGYSESTGSLNKNVFLGSFAGSNVSAGADRNIIIGYYNFLPTSSGDNQLVIGNTIYGTNIGAERDTISALGKIGIKTKTPARELHVAGELRVTNDVDTASVNKLWGSNTAGDFRRLVPGEGFSISNDTLNYSIGAQETMFVVDDGMKNSAVAYQSTLTMVGTGTVTVTLDTATNTLTFNGVAADSLGNTAGEANVGLNVGLGAQVYKTKTDTTLVFRTLVDDGLTTVTQAGDTIVINTPAQTADTFSILSDTIMLSLSSDGQPAKKIALADIAPVQSIAAGPGISLSGSADITISATDTSATNEIQTIDTFAIVSNVLRASLSSDGEPFKSVDLSPYLDDQVVAITGGGIAAVSGTYPTFSITAVEVDGSVSNEGILGVGAGTGTTSTITTNTSTGNAVTIAAGTGLSISESTSSNGGTITLTNTVVDTTTVLESDSILVYRSGGTEFLRDTIKVSGVAAGDTNFGSGTTDFYSVWSADTLKTGSIKDSLGSVIIKGNSEIYIGNASAQPRIWTADFNNVLKIGNSGKHIRFEMFSTDPGDRAAFIGSALTGNTTTYPYQGVVSRFTFAPSANAGTYNAFADNSSINQLGTSSGISRSFYANPTFMSVIDHRSFETVTDGEIAFSSTGTSDSRHAGSFRIGQHAAPARTLDVTGTLRASSNVDTATLVRLWAGNTEGDLRRVKLGTNLSISGDTLNAAGGAGNIGNGTDDFYAVFSSGDTLRDGIIKDTAGFASFRGKISLGTSTDFPQIMPASTGGLYELSGKGIRFQGNPGATGTFSPLFRFISDVFSTNTSGSHYVLQAEGSWLPTSGNATYAAFRDASSIAPGGSTTGVTRSFYANPTIIGNTSHRAFDVGTDSQIAFSSTGTSTSRHAGSFRIGQHAAPVTTLDVTGTLRASGNVDTAALVRIWAGNTEGDLRRVKLGTNLSVSGDTLNAAGGGTPYADIAPVVFIGSNTAHDTITEIKRDELEYDDDNGISGIIPLADVRIKNDTIVTLRGSHFSYFETIARQKTLASGASDTLDIDNISTKFDFTTTGNGTFTLVNAPDEVPAAGFDNFYKLFNITASISMSADSIGDVEAAIYIDGGQVDESVVEFTAESGKKVTIHVECQEWLVDGQTIDLRIKNASGTQRTYTIERLRIGAIHIKSAYTISP